KHRPLDRHGRLGPFDSRCFVAQAAQRGVDRLDDAGQRLRCYRVVRDVRGYDIGDQVEQIRIGRHVVHPRQIKRRNLYRPLTWACNLVLQRLYRHKRKISSPPRRWPAYFLVSRRGAIPPKPTAWKSAATVMRADGVPCAPYEQEAGRNARRPHRRRRESPAAKSLLDRGLMHLDATHRLLPASTLPAAMRIRPRRIGDPARASPKFSLRARQ